MTIDPTYVPDLRDDNVPSSIGLEILLVKDALVNILAKIRYHDPQTAENLAVQIDRLRILGYKA